VDFLLNDEQLQLKKSVREFAEHEIKPHVMEWDEKGEFPLATIKELGKLGLLGTVLGVIRAFRDLALSGSGGPTIVAAGIAEALIATACGIAVAVISAVLYNYFTTRVRSIVTQFDLLSQEVAILVYTGHGKGGH